MATEGARREVMSGWDDVLRRYRTKSSPAMARELYHRKARQRQTVKKAIASMTLPRERSVGLTAEGAANHALRPTLADTQTPVPETTSVAGRRRSGRTVSSLGVAQPCVLAQRW